MALADLLGLPSFQITLQAIGMAALFQGVENRQTKQTVPSSVPGFESCLALHSHTIHGLCHWNQGIIAPLVLGTWECVGGRLRGTTDEFTPSAIPDLITLSHPVEYAKHGYSCG
jgi:hypothetical protein